MFKKALALSFVGTSLLLNASAQSLQDLTDQINAAAGDYNGVIKASQDGDSLNLVVGEYDWVLTENNEGDFHLDVVNNGNTVDKNDLAAALAGLLGNVSPDNANALGEALNSAEQAGVVVENQDALQQNQGLLNNAADQIQNDPSQASLNAADLYLQTAAALAANENGANDQVNAALNNAADQNNINGLNDVAANADDAAAVASSLAGNLPETLPTTQDEALTEAVLFLGQLPPEEVENAINAAQIAGNALPASVANSVNDAALSAGIDLQGTADQSGVDLQSNLNGANNAAGSVVDNAADAARAAYASAIEQAEQRIADAILNGQLGGLP